MKIVHVDDFAHPDAGYEINLLSRLQVKQGHEVTIVTGELDKLPATLTGFFGTDNMVERDERFRRETGVKIVRIPLHAYYSGRAVFHRKIYAAIAGLSPDAVFVHGMESLTGIEFTLFSNSLPYPIVLDSHSVEMASVNRLRGYFRLFYRTFIAPLIVKRGIPVIRIVDSDFVEKCLGVPLSRTTLLSFGTDTDFFRPNRDARIRFREQHGISQGAFVVLYAGKLDAAKGGQLLADAVRERLTLNGREIVFVVVGNTAGEYGAQVEKTFAASNNRIIRLPTQRYYDLAQFYQGSDLALFPRQCSVSFFEAQSCGLPVLFEENEINQQRKAYGNATTFNPGDIADFRGKLLSLCQMANAEYAGMGTSARRYVVDNYNYVPIAQKFTDILAAAAAEYRKAKK